MALALANALRLASNARHVSRSKIQRWTYELHAPKAFMKPPAFLILNLPFFSSLPHHFFDHPLTLAMAFTSSLTFQVHVKCNCDPC
ncbi:hypothetical protein VNO80_01890 [Phaseolus coccineus]|uniref:Uncharacterized protein n=1 Tax=Phaseolus coccineus TaxID=3886 RepID=A0AAN9RT94_PHACN